MYADVNVHISVSAYTICRCMPTPELLLADVLVRLHRVIKQGEAGSRTGLPACHQCADGLHQRQRSGFDKLMIQAGGCGPLPCDQAPQL